MFFLFEDKANDFKAFQRSIHFWPQNLYKNNILLAGLFREFFPQLFNYFRWLSGFFIYGTEGALIKGEIKRKGELKMEKKMKGLKVGLMIGLMTLMASPAFARSISLKEAGTALWIFIIIGAVIVLLQLIPAAILFFSFIGTVTTMALKKGKKVEEEVLLPGAEPVVVEK